MRKITVYFGETPYEVEYEYTPAEPGNFDIESRTCCPPYPASIDIIDVKVDGTNYSIYDIVSAEALNFFEEKVLEYLIQD